MADTTPKPAPPSRPVVPPVVLATTFAFDSTADMADAAQRHVGDLYTRWSNPTLRAVEDRVAELEGAESALVVASGMAAISLALLSVARSGGVLLAQEEIYGGAYELAEKVLPRTGASVRRAPLDCMVAAASELPPDSAIYTELPTNPLVRVLDLPALRQAAPTATIVVDATFATPVNLRPLAHGADLVVHSATKYLAGHHDVIAGVIAGSRALLEPIWLLRKLLGPVLDPDAAYRVWRGLETLELRVERQNATAAELARRLSEHPAVRKVHHPSLPSHPDHALAARLLEGGGGVLSFELSTAAEAARLADGLRCFANAPSLGGVRSLVSWPAGVSHVGLSEEEQRKAGLSPALVRLSVGIEPPAGLWQDLGTALDGLARPTERTQE